MGKLYIPVLIMMTTFLLLASISTSSLGTFIQVPGWMPKSIEPQYIAYGLNGHDEYLRLSNYSAAAVASAIDGIYERYSMGSRYGSVALRVPGGNEYDAYNLLEIDMSMWPTWRWSSIYSGGGIGIDARWDAGDIRSITNTLRIINGTWMNNVAKIIAFGDRAGMLADFGSPTLDSRAATSIVPPIKRSSGTTGFWQDSLPIDMRLDDADNRDFIEDWSSVRPVFGLLEPDGSIYQIPAGEQPHYNRFRKHLYDWMSNTHVKKGWHGSVWDQLDIMHFNTPRDIADENPIEDNHATSIIDIMSTYTGSVKEKCAKICQHWRQPSNMVYRVDYLRQALINMFEANMAYTYRSRGEGRVWDTYYYTGYQQESYEVFVPSNRFEWVFNEGWRFTVTTNDMTIGSLVSTNAWMSSYSNRVGTTRCVLRARPDNIDYVATFDFGNHTPIVLEYSDVEYLASKLLNGYTEEGLYYISGTFIPRHNGNPNEAPITFVVDSISFGTDTNSVSYYYDIGFPGAMEYQETKGILTITKKASSLISEKSSRKEFEYLARDYIPDQKLWELGFVKSVGIDQLRALIAVPYSDQITDSYLEDIIWDYLPAAAKEKSKPGFSLFSNFIDKEFTTTNALIDARWDAANDLPISIKQYFTSYTHRSPYPIDWARIRSTERTVNHLDTFRVTENIKLSLPCTGDSAPAKLVVYAYFTDNGTVIIPQPLITHNGDELSYPCEIATVSMSLGCTGNTDPEIVVGNFPNSESISPDNSDYANSVTIEADLYNLYRTHWNWRNLNHKDD